MYSAAPYSYVAYSALEETGAHIATSVGPALFGHSATVALSGSVGPAQFGTVVADQVWVPHEITCYAMPVGPLAKFGIPSYVRQHIADSLLATNFGAARS